MGMEASLASLVYSVFLPVSVEYRTNVLVHRPGQSVLTGLFILFIIFTVRAKFVSILAILAHLATTVSASTDGRLFSSRCP